MGPGELTSPTNVTIGHWVLKKPIFSKMTTITNGQILGPRQFLWRRRRRWWAHKLNPKGQAYWIYPKIPNTLSLRNPHRKRCRLTLIVICVSQSHQQTLMLRVHFSLIHKNTKHFTLCLCLSDFDSLSFLAQSPSKPTCIVIPSKQLTHLLLSHSSLFHC